MKFWRAFDIEIISLKEGEHKFSFLVDEEFFSKFENDLLQNGHLSITVTLHKGANLVEAVFDIEGKVELICDRSLEPFDYPLKSKETILYKYGAEEKEINEDMYMITHDTPKINVAQLIYEFTLLALPAKKIHPDYRNELDEEEEATGQLVYRSEEDPDSTEEKKPSDSTEENIDPRWEALKNFKKKE